MNYQGVVWQEIFLERHYTNAAPQHSLNQGKQLWQGLENYILNSARTHGFKACVFTAPVYTDEDPVLEEESVRVPLEFWKVVVMEDNDRNKRHATAYLLSQGQLIRNCWKIATVPRRSKVLYSDPIAPSRSRSRIWRRPPATASVR
jgi:DNA/RNA endonuclease G (NUC1)